MTEKKKSDNQTKQSDKEKFPSIIETHQERTNQMPTLGSENKTYAKQNNKKPLWSLANIIQSLYVFVTLLIFIALIIQSYFFREQTTILQSQLINSHRAWITAKKSTLMNFKENQFPTAEVVFFNSGGSPALNVSVFSNMKFRDKPVPVPMPLRLLATKPSIGVLGSQAEFITDMTSKHILTTKHIKKITSEELNLYIWGIIKYDDIFNIPHETKFCFVDRDFIKRKSVGSSVGSLNICSNNNEAD